MHSNQYEIKTIRGKIDANQEEMKTHIGALVSR
jgi:hypothetical protein